MEIREVALDAGVKEPLAQLLACCFPCYRDEGATEAEKLLAGDRLALAAFESGEMLGFVGAIPQYNPSVKAGKVWATGWELHPLAVFPAYRGKGVGAALVARLEKILAGRGASLLYLGCDDERGQTSLSNTNLYADTFEKILDIRNLKRHPYSFYEKQGYRIVGVLPDANGPGKPDIWMAKAIGMKEESQI